MDVSIEDKDLIDGIGVNSLAAATYLADCAMNAQSAVEIARR